MKLELKHLAPYLPYGLKCTNSKESYLQTGDDRTGILETVSIKDDDTVIMGENGYFLVSYYEVVPILRPLSDLTKEIDYNGKVFNPFDYLLNEHQVDFFVDTELEGYIETYQGDLYQRIQFLPQGFVEKLLEWHFDVFGLIEKGLAIDINTLKQ